MKPTPKGGEMPDNFIIKEVRLTHPDGEEAVWFDLYDVITIAGAELHSRLDDLEFKTLAEARAYIDANS